MYLKALCVFRMFLFQFVLVIISSERSLGQPNTEGEVEMSKKLEDTVVNDMLRIVDHKFDTLTTRITALERAVSGLQFFSIRQFRQLSGHIQKTQGGIISVGKKVSQLETDGRGFKIAMSLLGRDVSELKSTTTDLLAELESSVVYINDNVDKQAEMLKNEMAEGSNQIVKATDELLVRHAEEEEIKYDKKEASKGNQSMHCSVEFTNLRDRLDVRLADFKQELVSQCFDPLVKIESQIKEGLTSRQGHSGSKHKQSHANKSFESSSTPTEDNQNIKTIKMLPNKLEKDDVSTKSKADQLKEDHEDIPYYDEYEEKMMNLLVNMTTSVLQAVSYFRQNGGLLEEILANTDSLTKGQAGIKNQLHILRVVPTYNANRVPLSNEIPSEEESRLGNLEQLNEIKASVRNPYVFEKSSPLETKGPVHCGLPANVINGLITISKNGSGLLEILMDLAQISSMSLTKATGNLQEEVQKMEKVRTLLTSTMSSDQKKSPDLSLERLTNNTKGIIKVVESNTGWLRLIYRNNQQVEKKVNQSLTVTNSNNQILLKNYKHKLSLIDASKERARLRETNQIPHSDSEDGVDITDSVSRSKEDIALDNDSLETIYTTSLQLNRIMPALTKLLAEPDPLLTLVDGGDTDRGRLEIYNNGQWGTVCHKNLTNKEANVICRHLGFKGGISAGPGRFGPGTGVAWTLNATCLESHTICSTVKPLSDMSRCNHDNDVAIICDHMLRIAPDNETTSNKIGRLEIMHQGFWLPICGVGWSGFSARVACKQMGFVDGRELVQEPWLDGANSTWLNNVACSGDEPYLDACQLKGWSNECVDSIPAGVRCL